MATCLSSDVKLLSKIDKSYHSQDITYDVPLADGNREKFVFQMWDDNGVHKVKENAIQFALQAFSEGKLLPESYKNILTKYRVQYAQKSLGLVN